RSRWLARCTGLRTPRSGRKDRSSEIREGKQTSLLRNLSWNANGCYRVCKKRTRFERSSLYGNGSRLQGTGDRSDGRAEEDHCQGRHHASRSLCLRSEEGLSCIYHLSQHNSKRAPSSSLGVQQQLLRCIRSSRNGC